MTTEQLTGPIPISRVWSGTKVLAEDLAGEDLGDVLDLHDDASAWWVLDRSSDYARGELRRLVSEFGLDPQVTSELTADRHRAKFEEFGQARLVLTHAVSLDPATATLTVHPVSLLLTSRAVVCLAEATPAVDPRRWLTAGADALGQDGTESALQVVMGGIVDSYTEAVDWLEQAADDLAGELFSGHPLSKEHQLWSFRVRTALTSLRRVTEPMRAVMTDLKEAQPQVQLPKKHRPNPQVNRRWRLLVERHQRAADAADSLRDNLNAVFETSLALTDFQLNVIMKKLTGWAAIIAVPTLVTGFAGMNVPFPSDGTPTGFWVYLVLMIVTATVLYVVFRRKDWI